MGLLENLLISGHKFHEDEYEIKLKYYFFNSLLYFDMLVVGMAGFLRLSQGNIFQAKVDFGYAILAFITIVLARKYRDKFQILVNFVMLFSFVTVTASFYLDMQSIVGVGWFMIQIIVVIFLTDKLFSYITLFFSITAIALITYLNRNNGYDILTAIYRIIPVLVAFVFLLFYEIRNQKSQKILKDKNNRLDELTHNLENLVEIEVNKNKEQSELLAKQSQAAALGEMMDAIAHQWMQPLSMISMQGQFLALKQENEMEITNEEIEETHQTIAKQINHLKDTITEFRTFFRPNKNLEIVKVKEIIDAVAILMKEPLHVASISLIIKGDEKLEISCIQNEFKHIFINLINNAKDAFEENKIINRKMIFELNKQEDRSIIRICDNAGGIPEEVLEKIFQSNFTTKSKEKGTGIGLYLSKQIVEKLDGSIKAFNIEDGVCFEISLKNDSLKKSVT